VERIIAVVAVAAGLALAGAGAGAAHTTDLRIGQPIVLQGGAYYYGQKLPRIRVTLMKVVDPATSPAYRPRKGTRFVAFQLRYTNIGKIGWETTPAADAEIVDAVGNTYNSVSIMYGSRVEPWPVLPPDLNHGLKLRPGESWTGYLGWVVLSSTHPREFHYTIPGSVTGIWRIRR
jgi:hypothetical protein